MITGAIFALAWNEWRSARTAGAIGEARGEIAELADVSKIDSAASGKLVHASGVVTAAEVSDPLFGVRADALRLDRKVEYYQLKEFFEPDKTNFRNYGMKRALGYKEADNGVYYYEAVWSDERIKISSFTITTWFEIGNGATNDVWAEIPSEIFFAPDAVIGAYKLPRFVLEGVTSRGKMTEVEMTEDKKRRIAEALFAGSELGGPEKMEKIIHANGNEIFIGKNPSVPNIGDVRVKFNSSKPGMEISLISVASGDTFEKYAASNGESFSRVEIGSVSAGEMLGGADEDARATLWAGRIVFALIALWGVRVTWKSRAFKPKGAKKSPSRDAAALKGGATE
jgi:hypothetical protein